MSNLIGLKDLARIFDCDESSIRRKIKSGLISAIETTNKRNRKKYLVPLSSLPADIQAKYWREIADQAADETLETAAVKMKKKRPVNKYIPPHKTLEELTETERQEYDFWVKTVAEWNSYRCTCKGALREADDEFVARMSNAPFLVSRGALFKKDAILRRKTHNPNALLDHRGAHNKGDTSVPAPVLEWFLRQYMNQRRLSLQSCYDAATKWCKQQHSELQELIPTRHAFARYVKNNIPQAELTYARYGEKAFLDNHQPYITRCYDDLEANEVWIADNHTLDIISKRDDGSEGTHRLYLTAFIDARSSVMVGWHITDAPSSQATIYALRHGMLRFGIPKHIYVDNGSEFLTHDVGGRGHRKRKSQEGQWTPPPIFTRLGITMINAIVKNAKAKTIERTFSTFKMQISQLFETFTGGSVDTRPEALKYVLKDGRIPLDGELRSMISDLIDGLYNVGLYGGAVRRDRNKRRIDVYNAALRVKRTAAEDDLNLLLMRTSKPQKVGRNGVYLNIAGEKLFYWQSDVCNYQGQLVYVRFDPENLNSVRVYEGETDRLIAVWPLARETRLRFLALPEEIAAAQRAVREPLKLTRAKVRAYKQADRHDQSIDILDVQLRSAQEAREGILLGSPKIIQPVFVDEAMASDLPIAVGDVKAVEVSMARMNRNREKRNAENRRHAL